MKAAYEKSIGPKEIALERVPVSEMKAKCLSYVEAARTKGKRFVITKRGIPVAQLVPMDPQLPSLLGSWKGRMEIVGDIVHTDWSDLFDALSE